MPTPRHGKPFRPTNGFTLVEMLIVFVIIGIIASIAFSRLSGRSNADAQAKMLERFIKDASSSLQMILVTCNQNAKQVSNVFVPSVISAAGKDYTALLAGDYSVVQPAKKACVQSLGLSPNNGLKQIPNIAGMIDYRLNDFGLSIRVQNWTGANPNNPYIKFTLIDVPEDVATILWARLDPLRRNAWDATGVTSGSSSMLSGNSGTYRIQWETAADASLGVDTLTYTLTL